MDRWDESYDIVVVGSGAAGLCGAITAAKSGVKVLVIEKAAVWGGTSAWSGGGIWAPANRVQREAGIPDSIEDARKYLDEIVTHRDLASTPERRMAFLRSAPLMVDMLSEEGMGWSCDRRSPDYHSERRHAWTGRVLGPTFFDARKLGAWHGSMRRGPAPYAIRMEDVPLIAQGLSSLRALKRMAYIFLRHKMMTALGQDPVGTGGSLMAQSMCIAQRLGVEVRLNTPLEKLIKEESRVSGTVVGGPSGERRIEARTGVLLAAGGFAHGAMRQRYQGLDGRYSSASPDDTGDVIAMADELEAMTELLDEAWWGSCFVYPGEVPVFFHWERSLPYSVVVDQAGQRFANEAMDYYRFAKAMIAHGVKEAWLIMDARHRRRYTFGGCFPGRTPNALLKQGFFKIADTLETLAGICGIDFNNLRRTVTRFNGFVDVGMDPDFQRGMTPYDRFWGDPTMKPNPNLGKIENGPFLAVKVHIGDLGTKGGLVTDANGRVLDVHAKPIPGLYAAGNTAASVMGKTYPGPGATLGPAMTFAFIAIQHAATCGAQSERPRPAPGEAVDRRHIEARL